MTTILALMKTWMAPTTATTLCKTTIHHKANVNRRQPRSNRRLTLVAFKPPLSVSKEADNAIFRSPKRSAFLL
jgi:hypothetical protein